jgi:hypothetical protein
MHENGTTISIRNLTLPIGLSDNGLRTYTATSVAIVTGDRPDGEPIEFARMIEQFLFLPDTLRGNEILIDEFSFAPYDFVRDLRWLLSDNQQSLFFRANDSELAISVTDVDATRFEAQLQSAEQRINLDLQRDDSGLTIRGNGSLELTGWVPLASFVQLMPEQVVIRSGSAGFEMVTRMPYDLDISPLLDVVMTPSSPLHFGLDGTDDVTTSVTMRSGSPINISIVFPDVSWSAQQDQAALRVSHGDWRNIPVSVSNVNCRSDRTCSLGSSIVMNNASLPIGQAERIELSSAQTVSFAEEGIQASIQPEAKLSLTGYINGATELPSFQAELVSAATLVQTGDAWQFSADSIDGSVAEQAITDGLSVSTPLFLESFVAESGENFSVITGFFVPASKVTSSERAISIPGLNGKASLDGAALSADFTTVGLLREGSIVATHNLDTGTGELSVTGAALSLGSKQLSDRVSPWTNNWNLSGGEISLNLQASWEKPAASQEIAAKTSVSFDDIAGFYGDSAFTGLSTKLDATYDTVTGIVLQPSRISVALIDIGLAIENISADYVLDANALSVDVSDLHMDAFDGTLTADSFSYRTAAESNNLTLHAESIKLSELLSIQEFDAVEVTGSISAVLPLTIEENAVIIEGGILTGEPPGGVIRYRPGLATANTDASGIGIATRALSNFAYKTLTSEVSYSRDGNLTLQMRITGRNPDLEGERPVVLNLGVENNVLQMLRSLQAARTVQDILEQRMAQ